MEIKRQRGFTLVELMIAMAVFVLVIAAATSIFVPLLVQFKQQSKMAETNIEGLVGLELLRTDIEHAGFGLPWSFQAGSISYTEPASPPDASDAPGNAPRAILSLSGYTTNINSDPSASSDYLVIKSSVVARNDTAQRWSYIAPGENMKTFGTDDDLVPGDQVILLKYAGDKDPRQLVMVDANTFSTTPPIPSAYSPGDLDGGFFIYGIDSPGAQIVMPFNRADYFISNSSVPARCAPNTGVLTKVIANPETGALNTSLPLPLLDCVAGMRVIFREENVNGIWTNADQLDAAGLNAAENIRNALKEVRIYILAHEGQEDMSYTYPNPTITLAEDMPATYQRTFTIGPDWAHYRWKVYTIVARPTNLVQ